MPPADADAVVVDAAVLRGFPLPDHGPDTSKDERGEVLVVGGSRETPGGVLLAGVAALRAGAGRLVLATAGSVAAGLAIAVPEARVVALPETDDGAVGADAVRVLAPSVAHSDALLVGTGAVDGGATGALLHALADEIPPASVLVVDAAALAAVSEAPQLLHDRKGRAAIMPNPREMARLLDVEEDTVREDPAAALDQAVQTFDVAVALRGPETWVSAPGAPRYVDRSGHPALATAGSGDVLGGVLAGLLARGTEPLPALLWAVHAHALAGQSLTGTGAALGLLARELLDELPRTFVALEG